MDRSLPFELRALEAALAHTTRGLEQESIQIERATLPSLKALMNKVTIHLCSPQVDLTLFLSAWQGQERHASCGEAEHAARRTVSVCHQNDFMVAMGV